MARSAIARLPDMASGKKRIAAGVAEAEQATADMACTAVSKLPDLSLSLPRASDRSDRGDREYRNRESQLPAILRLPLVIILSFALSSLGEALLNHLTNGELGAFSRLPDTKREIAALTVWRLLELALGWFGNFDSYDLAALAVLSRGPGLYLLNTFYGVDTVTVATRLSIEVLSNFVPFLLLRPVSSAHLASPSVFNREIVTDRILAGATVLLAGLIYHVTLFVALKWFLADTLVLYFDGIETVQPANEATVYGTLPMAALSVLFGLAARTFIFTPFATQAPTEADAEIVQFDPVRATMFETLWWNLWGYTASTKVAITRSAVVSLLTGLGTFVQCVLTIRGVGAYGAATYSAAWSLAALTTGSVLRWVGDV